MWGNAEELVVRERRDAEGELAVLEANGFGGQRMPSEIVRGLFVVADDLDLRL